MNIPGLAHHTVPVFNKISSLNCLKPYVLCGGTALALQINHRKSEDLDFMKWRTSAKERLEIEWPVIEKELASIGEIQQRDIIDINHVEFLISGVKVSFYMPDKRTPVSKSIDFYNHIRLADPLSILAMKIEVLMRRSVFRDYYDIYSILKTGININEGIALAGKYSNHTFKTKNMLSLLTRGERFLPDAGFRSLDPIYTVTPLEIQEYIKEQILQQRG